jgi:hypothetical protein
MEHDEQKPKKSGWYPGKLVGKAIGGGKRNSVSSKSQDDHNSTPTASIHSNEIGEVYEEEHGAFAENNPMNFSDKVNPVESQNESKEDGGEKSQSGKILLTTPLGKISLVIHEVRYLALQSARVSIDLEGRGSVFRYSPSYFPLSKEFELLDITNDLRLEFKGTHMTTNIPNVTGYVTIPICQALSATGKPVGIGKKWYEIYPFYDREKMGESKTVTKFRNAYPEVPGSALTKQPFPLGFVSLEVKLTLPEGMKNGLSLYFSPSPKTLIQQPVLVQVDEAADVNESTLVLTNARLNRDVDRIKNVLYRPFAVMGPFLSFPEVFVLIVVGILFFFYSFSCFLSFFSFVRSFSFSVTVCRFIKFRWVLAFLLS